MGCRTPGANIPRGGRLLIRGQDPGLGANATLVRAASPQSASPGTAPGSRAEHRQTDSNVSTHGQLTDTAALGPPHPGLTPLTSRLRGGSVPGGCGGPLAERSGQPSSRPSPAHGSAPAHLPLPDPRAAGRGCCPVPPGPTQLGQQHPSPAPKHAGFGMQLFSMDPGGTLGPKSGSSGCAAEGAQEPLPQPHSNPSPLWPVRYERLRTFYSAQLLLRCSPWAL